MTSNYLSAFGLLVSSHLSRLLLCCLNEWDVLLSQKIVLRIYGGDSIIPGIFIYLWWFVAIFSSWELLSWTNLHINCLCSQWVSRKRLISHTRHTCLVSSSILPVEFRKKDLLQSFLLLFKMFAVDNVIVYVEQAGSLGWPFIYSLHQSFKCSWSIAFCIPGCLYHFWIVNRVLALVDFLLHECKLNLSKPAKDQVHSSKMCQSISVSSLRVCITLSQWVEFHLFSLPEL